MGNTSTKEKVFEVAGVWATADDSPAGHSQYIPEARSVVKVNSVNYVSVDLYPRALLAIWTWVQAHLEEIRRAASAPEQVSVAASLEPEVIVGHRTGFQAP